MTVENLMELKVMPMKETISVWLDDEYLGHYTRDWLLSEFANLEFKSVTISDFNDGDKERLIIVDITTNKYRWCLA